MITALESVEVGDLARVVRPVLHIDKFKSKMGEDTDIIVLAFSVKFSEAAADLVDFIEKGYEWVLDADVSTGELPNGDFAVFVELERLKTVPEHIVTMLTDMESLTGLKFSRWRWTYGRATAQHPVSVAELTAGLPLTVKQYLERFPPVEEDSEISDLKSAAGIASNKKAPINEFTEALRIAAGLK